MASTLPFGPLAIYAAARQRNARRRGFQYLELGAMKKVTQHASCRLTIEQSRH